MRADGYQIETIPAERSVVMDGLSVGVRRHMVHALVEIDVTRARRSIAARKRATGEALSFTAFIIAAAARAIAEHKRLNAYRDWRNRLVLFDDVDVATLVERDVGEVALPHVIRAANRKSVREVHDELRAVQTRTVGDGRRVPWAQRLGARVPGVLRRLFLRVLRRFPQRLRRLAGTTVLTAVGMFGGDGAGWAVAIVPLHTLGLTLGGIVERPVIEAGQIVPRAFLDLTVSVDHDVVDGAPAARFVRRLRELIASADGLEAPARADAAQTSRVAAGNRQEVRSR
jgi:pyruvate/2-oxoglutarate dehydrogenase complex dihydrolipoamide acyltransferase (E2) component